MNYEYCGMLNWTTDCPPGSRIIFKNVLEMLRNKDRPKMLEVGTFAGTSIATMMDILPNGIGMAIDNWSLEESELQGCINYSGKSMTMSDVKNAFENNTNGRVWLTESDSTLALMELLQEKQYFDFIYVDGSHTALDTVLDITLSWMLLSSGGILGIDDYLYIPPNKTGGAPREAVDRFLTKFDGQYTILDKGYRLFLLKK